MTGTAGPPQAPPLQQVNLQTLVSAIQNSVQAQNSIAINIKAVTAAIVLNTAAIAANTAAFEAAFPPPLTGSATWTPGAILNGATATTVITVSGAVLGNFVDLAFNLSLAGCTLSGYVSASNTVTAVITNNSGSTQTIGAGVVAAAVTTTGV